MGYLGGVVPSVGLTPVENFLTKISKIIQKFSTFSKIFQKTFGYLFINIYEKCPKNFDILKFFWTILEIFVKIFF